ncbi:MAG: hypothetical protein KGH62_04170, partial [Candidatus Micrarchaeota archaeon]|nr:hypothetical protein [Candidatus Micrarchaeota archaeon]
SMQSVQLGVTNAKGIYSVTTVNVGSVGPGMSSTANVPMLIAGNASSLLSAQITLNYFYYSLYSDSEASNVTFSTQVCPTPLSVKVYPNVLISGVIQNITVNLTNTGTVPINSLNLHFTIPGADGAWLSPQPVEIPSIAPGNTILLNRNVYIANNQTDQSVPLNVSLIFYNGTKLNQLSQNLEILASGLIALSPSGFTTSPTNPTPDSIFSESFIITDTGTAGASALTATPILPHGFTNFGSNSIFVGSISADSQTPVTISVIASNYVKPGQYTIPIRLNYMNNLRQNLTLWANASIFLIPSTPNFSDTTRLRTNSSGGGGTLLIILILIVIVLAVLYYNERKKTKHIVKKE